METIKARVMNRIGTAAEWNASNPVILKGEIALIDRGGSIGIRVGDGIKKFNELTDNVAINADGAFKGTIDSLSFNPGAQTIPVYYIGTIPGVYPNFHGLELPLNSFGIFSWNGTDWKLSSFTFDLTNYLQKDYISPVQASLPIESSIYDGSLAGLNITTINNIPVSIGGKINVLKGQFTGVGNIVLVIVNDKKPVAGNYYNFYVKKSYTIPVTGTGYQTLDVSHLNIDVQPGDYLGIDATSPVSIYYGAGTVTSNGWYRNDGARGITSEKRIDLQFTASVGIALSFEIDGADIYQSNSYFSKRRKRITVTRNTDNYNSIRNLINSILDASETNQYEIFVPNGEWFEVDLQGKKWVKVTGESREGAIIYCDSTLTDPKYVAPSDYSYQSEVGKQLNSIPNVFLHVIYGKNDTDFKDCTIKQIRGKYSIHLDNPNYETSNFENVKVVEQDCTNAVGAGIWGGQTINFESCIFVRYPYEAYTRLAFFIHNQANQGQGSTFNVKNSKFINCGYALLCEIGSDHTDNFNFINCETDGIGEFQWMVNVDGFGKTGWINTATGLNEPNPKVVPYCIELNASGTKTDLVTIRDSIGFNAPYNVGIDRPLAFDHMITDYFGFALIRLNYSITKGDILCMDNSDASDGNVKCAKLFVSLTESGEVIGVALEDKAPGYQVRLRYIPKGKYAETKVFGDVLAGSLNKKLIWNSRLEASPTASLRDVFGYALKGKTASQETTFVKIVL